MKAWLIEPSLTDPASNGTVDHSALPQTAIVYDKGRYHTLLEGAPMKRDMDLVRELLLKLEALPIRRGGVVHLTPEADVLQIEGYTADQIDYHLSQIKASGWIDDGGARPMEGIGFRRLTPAGHDFLDAVRSSDNWTKTKKVATTAGGFTLDILKELAKGLLKQEIAKVSGVHL